LAEASLFAISHGAGGHGITFAIGELNDHAKQISSRVGLATNVKDWIFTLRLRALHEAAAEANLLDFVWRYTVPRDVLNPVLGPNEFVNPHRSILSHDWSRRQSS
jgi:hypothetical protein